MLCMFDCVYVCLQRRTMPIRYEVHVKDKVGGRPKIGRRKSTCPFCKSPLQLDPDASNQVYCEGRSTGCDFTFPMQQESCWDCYKNMRSCPSSHENLKTIITQMLPVEHISIENVEEASLADGHFSPSDESFAHVQGISGPGLVVPAQLPPHDLKQVMKLANNFVTTLANEAAATARNVATYTPFDFQTTSAQFLKEIQEIKDSCSNLKLATKYLAHVEQHQQLLKKQNNIRQLIETLKKDLQRAKEDEAGLKAVAARTPTPCDKSYGQAKEAYEKVVASLSKVNGPLTSSGVKAKLCEEQAKLATKQSEYGKLRDQMLRYRNNLLDEVQRVNACLSPAQENSLSENSTPSSTQLDTTTSDSSSRCLTKDVLDCDIPDGICTEETSPEALELLRKQRRQEQKQNSTIHVPFKNNNSVLGDATMVGAPSTEVSPFVKAMSSQEGSGRPLISFNTVEQGFLQKESPLKLTDIITNSCTLAPPNIVPQSAKRSLAFDEHRTQRRKLAHPFTSDDVLSTDGGK